MGCEPLTDPLIPAITANCRIEEDRMTVGDRNILLFER
jgi:hypothetical protein